eukprot:Skav220519  [mRNA]  locus=scaffold5947:1090:13658:- [translate_table: standard]
MARPRGSPAGNGKVSHGLKDWGASAQCGEVIGDAEADLLRNVGSLRSRAPKLGAPSMSHRDSAWRPLRCASGKGSQETAKLDGLLNEQPGRSTEKDVRLQSTRSDKYGEVFISFPDLEKADGSHASLQPYRNSETAAAAKSSLAHDQLGLTSSCGSN